MGMKVQKPRLRGRRPVARGRRPKVEIVLRAAHRINGQPYGPGKVHVTTDVAAVLLDQDSRAQVEEAKLHTDRAAIIGPRNRIVEVPPEMFDEGLAGALPFATFGRRS